MKKVVSLISLILFALVFGASVTAAEYVTTPSEEERLYTYIEKDIII